MRWYLFAILASALILYAATGCNDTQGNVETDAGGDGDSGSDGGGDGDSDGGIESDGGSDGGSSTSPVDVHGALSVSGNRIVNQSGSPVQLRGVSFGWSQWWPRFWTADTVDTLVNDWKVEIVRAAMGIEHDAYLANPAAERAKVITIVEAAIAQGIYVIIDWHDHNATAHSDEAEAFFSEMAQLYGDKPNVIYEIYNEPDGETWPQIKTYAEGVIDVIRAVDSDNLIIVGTPTWSQDVDIAASDPLAGTNIAYTLHFYAATHKQWLRDKAQQALDHGIALFVTEWGVCEASGTGYLDETETDVWLQFMDDNMLSWASWDIADKAGETCSLLLPSASDTGPWSEQELNDAGVLIRNRLRAYAGF